ncbi:MAG: benzoate-CoA ligase family protein [Trichlorobacter sp.]|uniref:benzoate-CoA ligase family protein n=1 Tax=Trichlorobacter sp. TaxID=2911007 RepID=UPI0025650370|nr:benzoate-CoA ligase family protein [Trichlorobacter sp.]MDK9718261.1 benzoate-CoA ligase family protein [Trichlorobacter sp.]
MTTHTKTPVNLAWQLLSQNLEHHPDKTAYLCNGEAVSYQQLADCACRFATLLQQSGIAAGDRVLLILPDSPVFIAAFLGAVLHGAIAVPVSTALTADDYRYILQDSAARFLLCSATVPAASELAAPELSRLICNESLTGWLDGYPPAELTAPAPAPDELAFMLYTSGSTGKPKGVPHRHRDLLVAAEQYAVQLLGMQQDDLIFSASKLFFAYGLGNSLAFPLYVGATAVLYPGKPLPDELLQLIAKHHPTLFFSVPTVYAQIILSTATPQLNLPMRLCISAGEGLPTAVLDEWQRLTGLNILDGIGTTELTHIFISNQPGRIRSGSAGQAVPGYQIRLVDDEGNQVPAGTPGHLQVRGASTAPCYWNLPEKSADTMLPDGFIKTGDVFLEEDGYYYHRGRSDDMLKAGGQWISPVQVEEVLRAHPSVADCAVASCQVMGLMRPAAHLMLKPDCVAEPALERDIRRFMASRLQDYMLPVRYFFVDDLPRTATGKVQRFKLKR